MSERFKIIRVDPLSQGWGRLTNSVLDYRRRDGEMQRLEREVYDHGSAAALLLFDPERDTVLLVRQFRLPPHLNGDDPDLLEVSAGLLDGEAPAVAAAREALEETGHAPRDIIHVCDCYVSPGSLTEKVSLFIGHYGTDTFHNNGGGIAAEGEEIELVEMSLAAAYAGIASGAIVDAKTIILIQHLLLRQHSA